MKTYGCPVDEGSAAVNALAETTAFDCYRYAYRASTRPSMQAVDDFRGSIFENCNDFI